MCCAASTGKRPSITPEYTIYHPNRLRVYIICCVIGVLGMATKRSVVYSVGHSWVLVCGELQTRFICHRNVPYHFEHIR